MLSEEIHCPSGLTWFLSDLRDLLDSEQSEQSGIKDVVGRRQRQRQRKSRTDVNNREGTLRSRI